MCDVNGGILIHLIKLLKVSTTTIIESFQEALEAILALKKSHHVKESLSLIKRKVHRRCLNMNGTCSLE